MKTKNRNRIILLFTALLSACNVLIPLRYDYQDFANIMDNRVARKAKYDIWNIVPPNKSSPIKGYRPIWILIKQGDRIGFNRTKEGENVRMHFNFDKKQCHFSCLFAPDGTILSWRFEDDKYKEECIEIGW